MCDRVDHGTHQFVARERNIHAVDLGRIDQPLHVLDGAEDGRAGGQLVAPYAFKDRRTVVDDVRHHVELGVIPVDEFAVVPDLFGLVDCHRHSLQVK